MAYIGNTADQQAFTPAIDYFNGDGSTVAFTLSRIVASVAQVQAVIENVPQNPGDAFTVSGNTITFTSAPPIGTSNIYVYYTSPITQVIQPGQGTVGTAQLVDDAVTSDKLASGLATQWSTSGANISYTTGNVGIGTSTVAPAGGVNLQLGDRSNLMQLSVNNGLYFGNNLYYDGSNNWRYNQTAAGSFIGVHSGVVVFGTASSGTAGAIASSTADRMAVLSNGDVVVNGSSGAQSAKFTSYSTGFNPAAAFYFGGTPGATTYNLVWFGSLGNGAAGALLANQNTVTLASVSDYRTKTNVEPLTNGISRVMQLAPKKFNWVGLEGETKTEGFIAHEVQAVVPDAAFGEKDAVNEDGSIKKQMMDASKLIPLLTSAIQEQQAIIEDLKARIETLESK